MFELNDEEINFLVSQSVIPSKKSFGGAKPFVFTEQGISSLSNILTSKIAIEIHINIMRAFVNMRKLINSNNLLYAKIENLEKQQISYQLKTDAKIEQVLNALENKTKKPSEGIFFDGQIYDAYVFINDLLKSAKSEVLLIDNYLGEIEIVFHTTKEFILNDEVKIEFILKIFDELEKKIIKNNTTKVGSLRFYPHRINLKIPAVKLLKLKDTKAKISRIEDWYIFEPHECTTEEQHFVEFIKTVIPDLQNMYQDIKLIRNEKSFEIYSFDKARDGARFEPDFILMLKDKKESIYQIFCEPKGDWTKDEKDGFEQSSEKWKNDFLKDITKCTNENRISLEDINENGLALYENSCYKILGLPFYNFEAESEFRKEFSNIVF